MSVILSFVLNIVIIVLLGATIYYAIKLSRSLNDFRTYREDFEKLLDELTRNISDAQRAIHMLKTTSGDSGKQLHDVSLKSRALANELQIMNELGERLAQRLEALTDKNKTSKPRSPEPAPVDYSEPARKTQFGTNDGPSFAIQDREFGAEDDASFVEDEEVFTDIPEHLQSQAERELYNALMLNKKKTSGRP